MRLFSVRRMLVGMHLEATTTTWPLDPADWFLVVHNNSALMKKDVQWPDRPEMSKKVCYEKNDFAAENCIKIKFEEINYLSVFITKWSH